MSSTVCNIIKYNVQTVTNDCFYNKCMVNDKPKDVNGQGAKVAVCDTCTREKQNGFLPC